MNNQITPTILIVDDLPSNIEILAGLLGEEYEILFATSGEEALEIAHRQIPDLILLDVVMPEMDGYTVCARLKEDEVTRDIPVIFVTGKDQDEDESKGLIAGGIDYITKPIRPAIVTARIRNHLELKRSRDSLKILAAIDGLTGIANRRRFDEVLAKEWLRAKRNQSPLSLLLMDIDFFKAFNDHYGHLAGDDCLRRLAPGLLKATRRPADLVARYGGEEFALLMPDTDADGCIYIANLVQENLKLINIPHAFSNAADHVTLSIGAATMIPKDEQTPFDLIKSADELLYLAKHNGRNQIRTREIEGPADKSL
jgi:diguanylate cyclase (GGDEF)-like protein